MGVDPDRHSVDCLGEGQRRHESLRCDAQCFGLAAFVRMVRYPVDGSCEQSKISGRSMNRTREEHPSGFNRKGGGVHQFGHQRIRGNKRDRHRTGSR
jgi:hypothetical protein